MSYVEKIQKYLEDLEKYLPGASKDDGLSIPIMMRKAAEEIVALQEENEMKRLYLLSVIEAYEKLLSAYRLGRHPGEKALKVISEWKERKRAIVPGSKDDPEIWHVEDNQDG